MSLEYRTSVFDRDTLIEYIKRELGIFSHNIELTEQQYNDIVDDAMQMFIEFAFEGTERSFMLLDIKKNQKEYYIDGSVLAIDHIFGGSWIHPVILTAFYNDINQSMFVNYGYSYVDYQIAEMYVNDVRRDLVPKITYNYIALTKKLIIFDVPQDTIVMLKVWKYSGSSSKIDENNLYNHRWIKNRCVALGYDKWYRSNIKYKGTLFDGNLEINLEAIGELAKEKLEETKKELFNSYTAFYGIEEQDKPN